MIPKQYKQFILQENRKQKTRRFQTIWNHFQELLFFFLTDLYNQIKLNIILTKTDLYMSIDFRHNSLTSS